VALEAFSDASLVDSEAGPSASLVRAARRCIEKSPASVDAQELDYVLCEFLSALWEDADWRRAWTSSSRGEDAAARGLRCELSQRCPLRHILSGARYALSFGEHVSNRKYFRNFGRLAMQATMLQDETRTGCYHRAILQNRADFEGKCVMDVGSGTGMLAFFAIQAGAAKVYCVEASPIAEVISELAEANGWADKVVVVNKVLQDIRDEVPEQVDCITHETLGNFLFAERGIETVLVARDKFLKPSGKLFPATAHFSLAPFEDAKIYQARTVKASNLWASTNFFGVDMSCLQERSRREMFVRPLSDQFHPDQLRADPHTQVFDFRTLRVEELQDFEIAFSFEAKSTCVVHGVAGWFDAHFQGSECDIVLSTSPWDTLTHWWMTRLMLLEPLAANKGQPISGFLGFTACEGNTYQCRLVMESQGMRRDIDGMDLAESDAAHRAPQHKTHQVTPHAKVQIIDWEATKASPTAPEVLVGDPLREVKRAAAKSEATAKAMVSNTTSESQQTSRSRDYGSQIRVNNSVYILVDDAERCSNLTKASAALTLIGSLDGALLMAPQQQPTTCLVEVSALGTGMRTRCWLVLEEGVEHMRHFVLKNQAPASAEEMKEMTEEQVRALDTERLIATYVMMKRARVSFRTRTEKLCLASS